MLNYFKSNIRDGQFLCIRKKGEILNEKTN
jgi:hypothetical protein